MGKPRDTKIAILPSTTRKGTTLSTSAALDSPSVIDKLVSPPHASRAGTSAESENSHNIDNVSAVLDDSGSLGSFLDATIAKSRQIENTETPNATTPVKSPELDYSSDDPEDYVELDDDFIEKCNATTDARKIKKLLAEHAVRYKPSPDPKFATSPINIRDKDYDFSLDLSHIAIVEKTPFCGTEKESAVEHLTELSTLSGVFSDDVKMRTYFVAKIFPFSLKDDAKTWYNNLPPGSIKSPTDLRDVFFKYFPASAQHAALQRIYNFDQEDGEKLPEAWARFCSLIRAQPDHDLEKHDLLDIFYSGLTIESRAYLDSCVGCVFRKRTPDDAEELLAKIGRNHDDWSTPEPTPTPIVKKRGMIKLNDEDMREAKKSLKEKGIKPEDVKNLPPIEDICETIPPSSMIEYMKDIVTNKRKVPNEEISTMLANYSFNGKIPKKLGDPEDDNMSIILGRPFLNTAGAVIDCNKGMVTFNVDDKEHTVYFPKRIDKPDRSVVNVEDDAEIGDQSPEDDEDELMFPELVDRCSKHAMEDQYMEDIAFGARFDETDDEEKNENDDSLVLADYEGEDLPTIEWNREDPQLAKGTVFQTMMDCRNAITTYHILTKNNYEVIKSEPACRRNRAGDLVSPPAIIAAVDSDHHRSRRQALRTPGESLMLMALSLCSIHAVAPPHRINRECCRSNPPPAKLRQPSGGGAATSWFASSSAVQRAPAQARGNARAPATIAFRRPETSSPPWRFLTRSNPTWRVRWTDPTSHRLWVCSVRVALAIF
ncbi:hypothetical protein QYE76_063968 [Lolium multiflorum]|uniref:Retrotransposon gag domain-containing protein n=1 Tax=Lolium multiflorum TaxID=4521 RepID=A0AAD8S6R3_LOLMU|nr:hypothetical protein QYE76_063968 [Lolium multiflorum]